MRDHGHRAGKGAPRRAPRLSIPREQAQHHLANVRARDGSAFDRARHRIGRVSARYRTRRVRRGIHPALCHPRRRPRARVEARRNRLRVPHPRVLRRFRREDRSRRRGREPASARLVHLRAALGAGRAYRRGALARQGRGQAIHAQPHHRGALLHDGAAAHRRGDVGCREGGRDDPRRRGHARRCRRRDRVPHAVPGIAHLPRDRREADCRGAGNRRAPERHPHDSARALGYGAHDGAPGSCRTPRRARKRIEGRGYPLARSRFRLAAQD